PTVSRREAPQGDREERKRCEQMRMARSDRIDAAEHLPEMVAEALGHDGERIADGIPIDVGEPEPRLADLHGSQGQKNHGADQRVGEPTAAIADERLPDRAGIARELEQDGGKAGEREERIGGAAVSPRSRQRNVNGPPSMIAWTTRSCGRASY